jgi:putative tryptophan/tyrosine transport system substrate-binding protein
MTHTAWLGGSSTMRRREFLALAAGVAAIWPRAARAQSSALPVIGFLSSTKPDEWTAFVTAFRQGLRSAGFVEGTNVAIEYRWANGQYGQLPGLADDLVRRQVNVIVASGGDIAMREAKKITSTIPIVSTFGGDPVQQGLIESLNRPGGNVTGVSLFNLPLEGKRIDLLQQWFVNENVFACLVNPKNPNADLTVSEVQKAASTFGLKVHIVRASNDSEMDAAFANIDALHASALAVSSDPFFVTRAAHLVALANPHIPTLYYRREFVDLGGLASYGTRYPDAYREMGIITGKILKGDKPAEIPVAQPTKFELVINLKAAAALGLNVPPALLLRADDVIE